MKRILLLVCAAIGLINIAKAQEGEFVVTEIEEPSFYQISHITQAADGAIMVSDEYSLYLCKDNQWSEIQYVVPGACGFCPDDKSIFLNGYTADNDTTYIPASKNLIVKYHNGDWSLETHPSYSYAKGNFGIDGKGQYWVQTDLDIYVKTDTAGWVDLLEARKTELSSSNYGVITMTDDYVFMPHSGLDGLYVMDHDGNISLYNDDNVSYENSFFSGFGNVYRVHVDQDNNWWVSHTTGLSYFNGSNWYEFDSNTGLANSNTYRVIEDQNGELLVWNQDSLEVKVNGDFIEVPVDKSINITGTGYGFGLNDHVVLDNNDILIAKDDTIFKLSNLNAWEVWNPKSGDVLGVQGAESFQSVEVFPSLVDNEIFFSEELAGVEIISISGIKVLSNLTTTDKIDVTSLDRGIYLIYQEGEYLSKFVKQ